MKKILVVVIVVIALTVAMTSVAFAAGNGAADQGFGGRAAGVSNAGAYCAELDPEELEQFKADRLAQYKERLNDAVERGAITPEQSDEYYAAKKAAMDSCSGDGSGQGSDRIGGMGTKGICNGTGYSGRGCSMLNS